MSNGPLTGIRVLDMASIIAAPVAATLLGDFGAEVIKIEEPGRGDFMRRGAARPGGRTLAWVQDARNKESITLDLRRPEGRDVLHRMLPLFDVVVTNFRPPTLEAWGLDPVGLVARYPRLIVLAISGYGHTGPYRDRGAFDRIASAFAGLTYVSGEPDRPPTRSGFALIDYMTAYMGAFGVVSALYHRDRAGGSGQVIDLALFEPGFRASEDALLAYAARGTIRERSGNLNPAVVPAANFTTADGRDVAIHAGTDPLFRRLAGAMGAPDLPADPRFVNHHARVANQAALYARIAAWVAGLERDAVMAALTAASVPAAPVMNIADIAADPHYRARGTVLPIRDAEFGELLMTGVLPKLSATPGSVRSLGPELGAGNVRFYRDRLGMTDAELARLREGGVI